MEALQEGHKIIDRQILRYIQTLPLKSHLTHHSSIISPSALYCPRYRRHRDKKKRKLLMKPQDKWQ